MTLHRSDGEGIFLEVRVTPGAAKEGIGGMWRDPNGPTRLIVRVTSPPEDGKANEAVRRLIAKVLGLSKSSVALVSGDKSRNKTLRVSGGSAIAAKLKAIIVEEDRKA